MHFESTGALCIPCAYVNEVVKYMNGRVPVCTVVGISSDYSTQAKIIFWHKVNFLR